MNTFILFSLAILALYVLIIQKFKHNWQGYPAYSPTTDSLYCGVSVIIAFRNEVSTLDALLTSLKKQVYPASLLEFILVNDHSDDGSEVLVRNFCETNPRFILINNQEKTTGKKSAIDTGIIRASHELIVTTDADCTMDKYWLATLARFYNERHPDMIIGLVDIVSGRNFFEKFQELEFLSLIAAGAGAAAGQRPIYCNAACFAYKKSLYLSMDDPLQRGIASGDDTLFMHAVKKTRREGILLLKSDKAIIITQGLTSWSGYINQRRRWVSKSRNYRDTDTLYTALLVLLVNLCIIVSFVLFLRSLSNWIFPVMFSVKTVTDLFFLRSFLQFYNKKLPVIRFIAYSVLYPLFATFFAITGLLCGYTWKGRRFGLAE
jgi:cellulose synthase/poly-beta-1,6-N-acetylglucosamine synthase-like glycosyltransferase